MIKTIAHFADIHVFKSLERHQEIRKVFDKVYTKLEEQKPDRIVIVGDTYNDYIDLEGEALILIGELLNRFSNIAPVIITRGNHEIRKKNRSRVDTVRTVTDLLQNPKITYYDKSGFYQDENVVWVVWDHVEHRYQNLNPWKDITHTRDKSLTYIDLYHDPIDGCVFHTGYNPGSRSLPTSSDFKGNYSFFGDIHLRQFFSKKTKGFCGSLIQQNFGEDPTGHGYLLWDIQSGIVQNIDIENEHRFIKFEINPGVNYDRLSLISRNIGIYNKFRVEWNEYAAFVTNENEQKIRKYLKDKYGADDIEIKPNRIYTDIKQGKMLSEVLDINNKQVQQEIIRDYLKENKYIDEFIDKIISVDDTINERLHLTDTKNIVWNIDSFWFNNFKSYGDDNQIKWDNVNGIVQIGGENQQGKTTIIDAICFILYGTTISTTKNEKNGNNRYINKNRNLNYCDGGAVLDINGEKYIMYRKVEREFKKGKEIKAVPMLLDYYKGDVMGEEAKLTGERKASTQELLNEVLGDFEDFVRLALTNADNLNSLLSMDRSVFIDSIIRDAGYDIFEKKLAEFKEYKKELNLEKINVNPTELQSEIEKIEGELKDKQDYLSDITVELDELHDEMKEKNHRKDELLIGLNSIDESLRNINVQEIQKDIQEALRLKDEYTSSLISLTNEMIGLVDTFDEQAYDKTNEQYTKYVNEKNKREIEIVQIENLYIQNEDKINNVDKDINIEKSKYFDFLKNNIAGLRIELREVINEINNNSTIKRNALENQKINIKNELSLLKQSGLDEKKKISDYTTMLNGENQVCVTCNQPILNKDEEHMNHLITESTKIVEDITKKGKQKIEAINECNNRLEILNTQTEKLIEEKKSDFNDKINAVQYKIDHFEISYIQDRIEQILSNKERAEKDNEVIKVKIDERKIYLSKLDNEIKKLESNIQILKDDKISYDRYKSLNFNKERLSSKLKDAKRTFDENTRMLSDYHKSEAKIIENESISRELSILKAKMEEMNVKIKQYTQDKVTYTSEITLYTRVLSDMKEKMQKFIEQEKREELHSVYLKLMHRTGLPTYLLTKNIDILNEELSSLLTSINFTLYFDEDLILKLQHDGLSDVINVIETSGMERTFSAIVLKMVLRVINFKSKPNFMFLDEVINRLVNKSVDKFMELLETLKTKIDKLIVIEHNNDIQSDLIINVVKDENGISKFEVI